jgi:hypothetical protein
VAQVSSQGMTEPARIADCLRKHVTSNTWLKYDYSGGVDSKAIVDQKEVILSLAKVVGFSWSHKSTNPNKFRFWEGV